MNLDGFRTAVAAGVVGLAMSATSASAVTEMVGGGFLSNFNAACGDSWPTGSTVQITMRMRPGGAPGNSETLTLASLFTGNLAMHIRYPDRDDGGWAIASGHAIIGGDLTVNPDPMARVRHLESPDGTVFGFEENVATHAIAEVLHFGGIENCRARVNVWLHNR